MPAVDVELRLQGHVPAGHIEWAQAGVIKELTGVHEKLLKEGVAAGDIRSKRASTKRGSLRLYRYADVLEWIDRWPDAKD